MRRAWPILRDVRLEKLQPGRYRAVYTFSTQLELLDSTPSTHPAPTESSFQGKKPNEPGTAGEGPPQAPLVRELTRRGISERRARTLLTRLAEGQPVLDQLEWGDELVREAGPGAIRNPAGFYIRLLEDNVVPPPSFETSRRRKAREEATLARRREEHERQELERAYQEHTAAELDRYVSEHRDDYDKAIATAKQKLLSENPGLYEGLSDEALTRLAQHLVRADLAKQLSLPSLEEFAQSRRSL